MNESKTLAAVAPQTLATSRGVALSSFADMKDFAISVHGSGLAPRDLKTPEAILVAMQFGMEIGLTPMQALQSIAVINGRPCVWGDAAAAIVKAHPEFDDMIETFERGKTDDDMLAKCEVIRKNKQPVIRTFSIAQAKKASLWGKAGPWTQYPQRMLQMRARSWAMRDAFPDALKGVGVAEEVTDHQPLEPRQANARVVAEGLVLPGDDVSSTDVVDEAPEAPTLTLES